MLRASGAPNNQYTTLTAICLGECKVVDEDNKVEEQFASGILFGLKDVVYGDEDGAFDLPVCDFFISNSNKLHIVGMPGSDGVNNIMRYVIESMDAGQMKLRSYDGKCTMTLKKEAGASNIGEMETSPADGETAFYTVNGIRVQEPGKGLYIVRKGSKSYKIIY